MANENGFSYEFLNEGGEDDSGFFSGFDYQSLYGERFEETIVADPRLQEASAFITDLTDDGSAVPYDSASRLGDKLFGAVTTSLTEIASALGRREVERIAPLQPAQGTFLSGGTRGGGINIAVIVIAAAIMIATLVFIRK